ncbi:MAG: Hsp20 family protein [Akkermansiaceae bacterium]|nr:Hsp20 family protein [Akkermansiaceae bacterium]MCF7730202.1 Hsp20 family protein [Akkermansiaceae bacterium]
MNRARLLVVGLAAGASLIAVVQTSVFADETKKDGGGILEKMDRWQDRMSEKFRETWDKLRNEQDGESLGERSVSSASVDLREQKDSYIVRLNLPGRDLDKVEVKLDGATLHILAPESGKAGKYEQVVELVGVADGPGPKVERRADDHMIVITVPKTGKPAAGKSESSQTVPDPVLLPLTVWDRDVVDRMERMRREMDRIFADAFREFDREPGSEGFFDLPSFGSAIDLQDEGESYVVRAYLPDRDMDQLGVTVDGQTLKIDAKAQGREVKKGDAGVIRRSRTAGYSQMLTLPGPVQVERMKVDRKENMVVITLPKAK